LSNKLIKGNSILPAVYKAALESLYALERAKFN